MGPHSALLWQKAHDALDSKNKAVVPPDFATKPEKMVSEVEKYISKSQGKPIRLPNGENLFVRDVLQKVSRWIKKFVEVGDAAMPYDPGHAALPWALLRLLLQASMNNVEKHAAVLEGIEKITYYLVWARIEEAFLDMPFEAHAQLQLDFIQLYTAVLTFVTRSIRFLKNKPQRLVTAFFSSESKFQKDMEQMATQKLSIESHVQQIMDQSSLKQWDEVKGQLADLHQPLVRIEHIVQATSAFIDRTETQCILNWASETPFEKHFATVHHKALDGTGQWLFKDPDFVAWETCSRSQILWLHGSSGSGKSTLISMVVQSLMTAHDKLQGPYPIYFFCARNTAEPERADAEHILRSLMRQASDLPGGPPLHRVLKDRYEKRRVKGNVSADEAAEILISTVETRPATYILIDALDECDRQNREILLDALKSILARSNSLVKIFVTSRDNHHDIALSMDGSPALCIDASRNQKDIEYYVQHSVQRAIDRRRLLPTERVTSDLQQAIVDSLCNGADGMFRWVELQLELLYSIRVRSVLLERLTKLPPKLEGIYNELYDYKMQELGPEQAKVVQTILSWLLVAKAPLHTSEICQLICTSEDPDMSVETILDMTFDLIRLDTEQDQLKFSHLSVREFLEKRHAEYGQIALQSMATSTCLNLLARVITMNAESYAALYWPFHAEDTVKNGGCPELEQQLDTFLTKHNRCFETWNNKMLQVLDRKSQTFRTPTEQRIFQSLAKKCNPLLVAACFALSTTIQRMISQTEHLIRINLRNLVGESALQLASQYGSVESVQALLDKSADANTQGGEHGNALCAASFKGYMNTVTLLLNNGADVNAIGGTYMSGSVEYTCTALHAAAFNGHADVVELLLCNGVNSNARIDTFDERGRRRDSTALHAAASEGHERVVELLLLTKDADVNAQGGEYGNALCAASSRGYLGIVKLLLDKGATVNAAASGRIPTTALCAALFEGHINIAKLLLHRGADINAQGGFYGSVLCAALSGESQELVISLLDMGADVNSQGGYYGNALQAAICRGSFELVLLLLGKGADVNAHGGCYGNALQAASYEGHTDIVQLLLQNGADVNAWGTLPNTFWLDAFRHKHFFSYHTTGSALNKDTSTALYAAAFEGHKEIVELLLNNDADINVKADAHRADLLKPDKTISDTVLHAASRTGCIDTVKLLLSKGADVNVPGGLQHGYSYPLQAALYGGHQEVSCLLLDAGANVKAQRQNLHGSMTSLPQTAESRRYVWSVSMPLENGAFVNTQRSGYDIVTHSADDGALKAASSEGHQGIVEMPLYAGANTNSQAERQSATFQAALPNHYMTIANQMLGQSTNSEKALQTALSRGDRDIVKKLFDNGITINWQGELCNSIMRAACASKTEWPDVVEKCLRGGADINAQGLIHTPPLQLASARGHEKVVELLLNAGADVNALRQKKLESHDVGGEYQKNALCAAAYEGHWEVVRMLLDVGATENSGEGEEHGEALFAASSQGHVEVVRLLLDMGSNVNSQGGNSFQEAFLKGHWEVTKLLIDRGADVNAPSGMYGSTLQAACISYRTRPESVRFLLDAGADVNAQGGEYGSALQAACATYVAQSETVRLLLDAGADVNAQGGRYGSALQAALRYRNTEVVELLQSAGAQDLEQLSHIDDLTP